MFKCGKAYKHMYTVSGGSGGGWGGGGGGGRVGGGGGGVYSAGRTCETINHTKTRETLERNVFYKDVWLFLNKRTILMC